MRRLPWYSMSFWAVFIVRVLLPLLALAIEVGRYSCARAEVAKAADAAALAAAIEINRPVFRETGQLVVAGQASAGDGACQRMDFWIVVSWPPAGRSGAGCDRGRLATWRPSFMSSPRMRSAQHKPFCLAHCWIKAMVSEPALCRSPRCGT